MSHTALNSTFMERNLDGKTHHGVIPMFHNTYVSRSLCFPVSVMVGVSIRVRHWDTGPGNIGVRLPMVHR